MNRNNKKMDYKQMIGKEVIGFGKDKGKIKGIDKQGRLQIKYEGYTDTYCFDPFIKGCVMFLIVTIIDGLLLKVI